MKLFIWNDPISPPYGGSFLFVVARDEVQARKIAKKAQINAYGLGPAGEPLGDVELGKPRIESLPYGECYYWAE